MAERQLDRAALAAMAGINTDTLDTYKRDGRAPAPDGYIGRSPWWYESTAKRWVRTRRTVPGRVPGQTPK